MSNLIFEVIWGQIDLVKVMFQLIKNYLKSAMDTLSSVKNVASTCEQIPTLDLHLKQSSVFYELKHKDPQSWPEVFKPELDRHGLMGHTYLNATLYKLQSRALGIR